MDRKTAIQGAYKALGKEATFYDGMITCSTLVGKAICKVVWNMSQADNNRFIEKLYTPKGFFTPPYETLDSLKARLSGMYEEVEISTVESMACFTCRKGE